MAERETFGSSIPGIVTEQLKIREEHFGDNSKDRNTKQILNSSTGWARFSSSVNKIKPAEATALASPSADRTAKIGTSFVAQNYVLIGGTPNPESQTPRAGILRSSQSNDFKGDAALNKDTEAYLNYNSYGYRPMPGITSVKVTHKGAFGQLFEAEVGFKIMSREQLNDAELIYFRPGYTALLEIGHTVYMDNKKNLQQAGGNNKVFDLFFQDKVGGDKLREAIFELRENASANHQALYGFIKNFNWSFNADGTYDCKVNLISQGEVVESIKSSNTSSHLEEKEILEEKKQAEKKAEITKEKYKSTLHYFFNSLYDIDWWSTNKKRTASGLKVLKGSYLSSYSNKIQKELSNKTTNRTSKPDKDIQVLNYKINVQEEDNIFSYVGALLSGQDNLAYISLRSLLVLLNTFEILKDPVTGTSIAPFSLEYGNKYATFPDHFSVNPANAILPKLSKKYKKMFVGRPSYPLNKLAAENGTSRDPNDILNIHVSALLILREYDKIIDGVAEGELGILDFLKGVLAGVQAALGNVNNFDLYLNEGPCLWEIIDRRSPTAVKADDLRKINVTGLSSTVVDIGVTSKISANMSAQISIASQGNTKNYKENVQNILQWNKGAIDRHLIAKDQVDGKGKPDGGNGLDDQKSKDFVKVQNSKDKEMLKMIEAAYEQLQSDEWFITLNIEELENLQSTASSWIKRKLYTVNMADNARDPLPVPIELNIKMLGIAGLKIGTAFGINSQILPERYTEFFYQIKSIDHEIGTDNKWYTNIGAYMFQTSDS